MMIKIEELEEKLREALKPKPLDDEPTQGANYELLSVDQLKEHIKAKTGARPQGNPSQATLVAMCYDLDREDAETAAA
jgi:hypothetical protein